MVLIGDRARAHFTATVRQPLIERRAHGMLLKSPLKAARICGGTLSNASAATSSSLQPDGKWARHDD